MNFRSGNLCIQMLIGVWFLSVHFSAQATGQFNQDEIPLQSTGIASEKLDLQTAAVIAGGVSAVMLYGMSDWWKQGFSREFHTINEGWFGRDTYAGGIDKLGHAYGCYAGARLLSKGFEQLGHDSDFALKLATATSFGSMLLVEVLDGYYWEYGFSTEDVIMNGVGAGLAILLEKSPELDRKLDFRLQYIPSDVALRHSHTPQVDYSGQTYLLVIKAAGFPALNQYQALRYLEFDMGYAARGYRLEDGSVARHSRHVYLGLSLNLAEILDETVFKTSQAGFARRATHTVLEYIQIPGTSALVDHPL